MGIAARDVVELGLPDTRLAEHLDQLTDEIVRLINLNAPDDVYVTCKLDPHPDHAAAYFAAERAVCRARTKPRLLEYPIWLWSVWPYSRKYRWGTGLLECARVVASRSAETVQLSSVQSGKRSALEKYVSQLDINSIDELRDHTSMADATKLPRAIVRRALAYPELAFKSTCQRQQI